jgi:hypothetical protein
VPLLLLVLLLVLLLQPKLASLDSINLAALMGSFSALKYEPEPQFMRAFYHEVYEKLPLFDDQVGQDSKPHSIPHHLLGHFGFQLSSSASCDGRQCYVKGWWR